MKLVLGVLCLPLLLGIYSLTLAEDNRKPVDLSFICIHVTHHENTKAPILLLHGLFNFKETWYGLMTLLTVKTGRKVCAADLRNHGDSPWSDEFDSNIMAKDVERLMETLKFEKIVLLGHSLGGKVAVQFALTNTEKVEKLIVEDMRPNSVNPELEQPDLEQNFTSLKDSAEDALKAIPEGATEFEAKRAIYNYFLKIHKEVNEPFHWDDATVASIPIRFREGKWTWKANVDVLDKVMDDRNKTMPYSHGQFNGPSLFIYGEKSPGKVGDVKEEILQLFPNADIVGVKNASHYVQIFPEYKVEVVKFILK